MTDTNDTRRETSDATLELVSFRLTPKTTSEAFQAAAAGIDRLLDEHPAFVSRRLTVDGDGLWTDVIEWRSMAEALHAAETLVKEPEFAPFGEMIDMESLTMRHALVQHRME